MAQFPPEIHLDVILSEMEKMLGGSNITAVNILTVTLHAMQLAGKYPSLKGSQKRDLVIHVLTVLIKNHNADETLLALVPAFIETTIDVEKGKVVINVDIADIKKCCGCF